ncbi:MAG: insulinase family protein, partial [Blastocatellia bacterium]|nr:insulinase family protein [Blastocatellia bacterium]
MKLLVFIFSVIAFAANSIAQNALSPSSVTEFSVGSMKVLVKKRTGSPTVAVGLVTRGGARNQTEQNAGIESLTWSVATEGSRNFPRQSLREELARTGTTLSGAAGYDLGGITMVSTTQNFARSWAIFTDAALNPTFLDADVSLIRESTLAAIRNRTASPESALSLLEERVVYSGHPYAASPSGTMDTVLKFTAADLRAFHKSMMQSSRLLLVVVGNVDPEEIRKLATASFGSLPRGDYAERPVEPLKFAKSTVDVSQRALSTNYVKGIFAAPPLSSSDYYAMRVAVALLQSRVYQEVRVKRNLSYAPNAEMGNLAANTANIYVTAVDANQAIDVMLKEIADLRTNAVADDDFVGVPGFFLTTY